MPDRPNRRDLIIHTAATLFLENSYNATSVRQIAEAVGVTEAALYYHFKDGKRGLLQAVLEHYMPNLIIVGEQCASAPTLADFVRQFIASQDTEHNRQNFDRLRWVLLEYPNLSAEEQAIFHHKAQSTHAKLAALVRHYVSDAAKASKLAWLLIALLFGYGQMFFSMGLMGVAPQMQGEDVIALIGDMFGGQADTNAAPPQRSSSS